jgi:hypothetical protein
MKAKQNKEGTRAAPSRRRFAGKPRFRAKQVGRRGIAADRVYILGLREQRMG